jgi:DNA-binding MarR family transcriptional regulator
MAQTIHLRQDDTQIGYVSQLPNLGSANPIGMEQPRRRPIGPRKPQEAEEHFPPLTVSLPAFVRNGSDGDLRRLIYSLVSLSGLMERNREYFAAYIGVSVAQFLMMTVIAEVSEATVSLIADRLSVSTQFVTIEINKLVAKEIIQRRPNPADRRSAFLGLTPKGVSLLRELGPLRRKINDITFHSLARERAELLQEILDDLVVDARRAVHDLEAPDMRDKMAPSAVVAGRGKPPPDSGLVGGKSTRKR